MRGPHWLMGALAPALLIVVGSEVIPSLEPLSGRAREPPRPGHYGRPATTRTRESAQRQAEGQVR